MMQSRLGCRARGYGALPRLPLGISDVMGESGVGTPNQTENWKPCGRVLLLREMSDAEPVL
jgi:hypothetical protein